MARDHDDEALSWEGDEDSTLAPGWTAVGSSNAIEGASEHPVDAERALNRPDAAERSVAHAADDETVSSDHVGSVLLVVLGVLGGVYLLYTVGWAIVAAGSRVELGDPVAQFMYSLGIWLAVLAAPAWFGTTLWLTRGHVRSRVLWLVVGVLVLVPLPFILR